MEGMGGLKQSSSRPVVPLRVGPPCKSHAELRWHLTKEFRPNLTEEMPHLESPETPLLGESGGVYVGIFSIFVDIDG
jgi:hypothetical protein